MSELTKKLHTEQIAQISWHGNIYAVPLDVIEQYKINDDEDYMSIDDVFSDLTEEFGEPGVLVKGLRARENLSQNEFAKKINIGQANLSAIENGRRAIGKALAKRISEAFNVDYKIFL